MSIFDAFTNKNANDAAQQQIQGLQQGNIWARGDLNTGATNAGNALTTNYTAALQPYLQNRDVSNAGVQQLENVLGFGPGGSAGALSTLRSTPGYQFAQGAGNDAINAAEAASGKNASGNQLVDLSKFNQGLADQTYNNYVGQLQPFLGQSNTTAAGIGNIYTGLGQGQANIDTGLGSSLAGLDWNTFTGAGNANANATLANNNASGNFWNALGGIGGLKTAGGGTLGGNALGAAGSALSSGAGALFGMFSDKRLKEDAEKVGELYDGQDIYKYRYIGDPIWRIGLMAQDVEKTNPEAVKEIGGFKAVDYNLATRFAAELQEFI